MAEHSLGYITPGGGGPTRATANQTNPSEAIWAHSYRVQHVEGNTGKGYVGDSELMDGSTGEGVVGILPKISAAEPWPPLESPPISGRTHPHNMAEVWIDADESADSFLVTYVQI